MGSDGEAAGSQKLSLPTRNRSKLMLLIIGLFAPDLFIYRLSLYGLDIAECVKSKLTNSLVRHLQQKRISHGRTYAGILVLSSSQVPSYNQHVLLEINLCPHSGHLCPTGLIKGHKKGRQIKSVGSRELLEACESLVDEKGM